MSSKPNTSKPENAVLSPDQAIAKYKSAVETQPTAANYLELGAAYYVARRWDDALAAFQKTVELDPQNAFGYYYLGILYAAQGQRDQANAALEKVLQVSSNPILKAQAQARIPQVQNVSDLGGK